VDAPEAFKRLYDGVRFDADPARHDSRLRMVAMVSQLDAKVGEMVAALDETGQRQDTLVVFTSDNGGIESLKNAYVGDVPDSPLNSENDPLRGQKNTLWEGGVRVCAFANWPGVLTPRKCSAVIHAADWFPTLAGLLELQQRQSLGWDGIDRWGAITGSGNAARPKPLCIVHTSGRAMYESNEHGDWKLILRKKGPAELYDIATDPFEEHDLAAEQPDAVARLTALAMKDAAGDLTKLPADLQGVPEW
jgi:arylsulfatase A-like enzyme